MAPWRNDLERALWVLSDSDVARIPEQCDGRSMCLIGELYVFQTKYNPKTSAFWHDKRFMIGTYNENGEFETLCILKREDAVEFVTTYYQENQYEVT